MTNFRDVECKLCIVPNSMVVLALDPEHTTQANAALCCGYVDHRMGLTYEVLGLVRCVEEDYALVLATTTTCIKLRADSVEADMVRFVENKALMAQFADRIKTLKIYYSDADVAEVRTHRELDPFRHPYFPDDVQVIFCARGTGLEKMWVRTKKIHSMENHALLFSGELLNEPNQNLGVHQGSVVTFAVVETSHGSLCVGVPNAPGCRN